MSQPETWTVEEAERLGAIARGEAPVAPRAFGFLVHPCATCSHWGFSHDNWQDCCECACEDYVG